MSVDLACDWEAFNKSAERLLEHTSRTMPEFANGQMLRCASFAQDFTQKANADAIAQLLGQVGTTVVRSRKTGAFKKGRRIFSAEENSFAARIINSRLKKLGQALLWGQALADAVRKMINARIRSAAFILSGWNTAIATLAAVAGYKNGKRSSKSRKITPGIGWAEPAKFTLSGPVVCTIANTALIEQSKRDPERHSNPMPVAERGLQLGLRATTADMDQHYAEKFQPIFSQAH